MPAALDSDWALVAVRGTAFFAGEVEGRYAVFVQRGSVAVVAAGAAVVLEAGQGTDIPSQGAPPGQAVNWGTARVARTLALVGL
jgi:ferric-dicitrate binding protein FerR (iron transport regulator)